MNSWSSESGYFEQDQSYWSVDAEKDKILAIFSRGYPRGFISRSFDLIDHLQTRLQVGLKPVVSYLPEQIKVRVLPLSESLKNNRLIHSLKATTNALSFGHHLGLDHDELEILAITMLFHDLFHPPLSHVGDRFFKEAGDFIGKNHPNLNGFLSGLNLVGDHEDRLIGASNNDFTRLAEFLRSNFMPEQIELIQASWQERTQPYGKIKSIVDTATYLEHDSVFFALKPPDFIGRLKYELCLDSNNHGEQVLALRNNNSTLIADLLRYRKFMYTAHYCSPVNQLIESWQVKILWEVLKSSANNEHLIATRLVDFANLTDPDLVRLMRREALRRQSIQALSFFSLLPEDMVFSTSLASLYEESIGGNEACISRYQQKKLIGVYSPDQREEVSFCEGASKAPTSMDYNPLLNAENIFARYQHAGFWPTMSTLIRHIQTHYPKAAAYLSPEEVQNFFTKHFKFGEVKVPLLPQERTYAGYVSQRIATFDEPVEYSRPVIN